MMKKRYFAIPILAIALHFLLSNLLYFLVERLVLDVFHIPPQQFMKHSYWGEILIYAVLILVFFTLYKLLWRKDISEPRTATNFKDVLGSLVVGFGICGISGLWIMLAEQLPSLQKSVEAMNAGAENIAGGNAFGTFMIAVIAAPVVEEILFRGIVLRSMRKFTPAWAAILISSVLFGAYHLNIVQAAYATFMGIAAGILYEKKKNLLFPILVHFANNLITMLQGFAPSEVNELISITSSFGNSIRSSSVIIDIRHLQPVRPAAAHQLRFDDTIPCPHSFDDLTAADVNTDVSLMPNRKAGNVRHCANGAGFPGVIVHLVCADIRHPMGTIVDGHRFRGQPAVALDEPYAVGGPAAQPVTTDEVLMIANTVRVLRHLVGEE